LAFTKDNADLLRTERGLTWWLGRRCPREPPVNTPRWKALIENRKQAPCRVGPSTGGRARTGKGLVDRLVKRGIKE